MKISRPTNKDELNSESFPYEITEFSCSIMESSPRKKRHYGEFFPELRGKHTIKIKDRVHGYQNSK